MAGYFSGVSNIVQHQLSDLFEDTDWLLDFVGENSKRLGAAYDAIAGTCSVCSVPCVSERHLAGQLDSDRHGCAAINALGPLHWWPWRAVGGCQVR